MEKISLILLALLLCSCTSESKTMACHLYNDENELSYTFIYFQDEIESITFRRSFVLPYSAILNEQYKKDLDAQLDDTYHYEDNVLIQEFEISLDQTYSMSKTKELLQEKHYVCQ